MGASVFALTDKVAIVTGGGRGIGKAIALEFAKAGAHVVVAARTMSELEKVAAEIRKLGRRSLPVATDVSKPEDVENMIQRTVEEFGKIDILVNNAGASGAGMAISPVKDTTVEDWDSAFAVDMKGVFLCSKEAGKVMIAQNKGKIINISSGLGVSGTMPGVAGYSSAKAGVILFTKALAVEWAGYNINVNCIAPGLILTEEAKRVLEQFGLLDKAVKVCALQRGGLPEDIAYGAIYLASEASDFMTGALLVIDGGPAPVM